MAVEGKRNELRKLLMFVFGVHGCDLVGARRPKHLENFANLPLRVTPGEKWPHFEHFSNNTACSPDVYLFIVVGLPELKLGSAVIARADVGNGSIPCVHLLCGSEITELERVAILLDQNILWLHISV